MVRCPSIKKSINPKNKNKLPTKVQKNISVTASPIRSDFAVNRKRNNEESNKSSKLKKIKNKCSVMVKINPEIKIRPKAFSAENLTKLGFVKRYTKNIAVGKIQARITLFCQINKVVLPNGETSHVPSVCRVLKVKIKPPVKAKKLSLKHNHKSGSDNQLTESGHIT